MASYFVDPAIAANSGAGTIGDPFGDLQYALNTITQGSQGDQINIKAGTAEVLTATLSYASYGTPHYLTPITFRGYTSAENDGGIGEISGAGSYSISTITNDGIRFRDLKLGNCGASARVLSLGRFGGVYNCEIHGCSGGGITGNTDGSVVQKCHLHNLGGYGVTSSKVADCVFVNGPTNSFGTAVNTLDCSHSIFILSGTSNGIELANSGHITNNSLYTSGTGKGMPPVRQIRACLISGNIFEGFSMGIELGSDSESGFGLSYNAFYNCTTDVTSHPLQMLFDDNESLGSSPFAKSGTLDYANRLNWFALNDVGNVRAGLFGRASKGAIPFSGGGGGGGPAGFPLSRTLNTGC